MQRMNSLSPPPPQGLCPPVPLLPEHAHRALPRVPPLRRVRHRQRRGRVARALPGVLLLAGRRRRGGHRVPLEAARRKEGGGGEIVIHCLI